MSLTCVEHVFTQWNISLTYVEHEASRRNVGWTPWELNVQGHTSALHLGLPSLPNTLTQMLLLTLVEENRKLSWNCRVPGGPSGAHSRHLTRGHQTEEIPRKFLQFDGPSPPKPWYIGDSLAGLAWLAWLAWLIQKSFLIQWFPFKNPL
jgi:hypothetical protein